MVDPYTPPSADVTPESVSGAKIQQLPQISVLLIFALSFLTLGIYNLYWLYKRCSEVNGLLDEPKIPTGLMNSVIALFAANIILSIWGSAAVDETILLLSNLVNLIYAVLLIYLVFVLRHRLNLLANAVKGDASWFWPIMTFFFQALYLQYKINKIQRSS